MKLRQFFWISLFFVITACAAKPMVKIENMAIPQTRTPSQVQKIIRDASVSLGWSVKKEEKGRTDLALFVRSHILKISVIYDKKQYSIRYRESSNLEYDSATETIHRSYNKWISNLNVRIQQRL